MDFPLTTSARRSFPIKRADAEPLTREDIQHDFLDAVFKDPHAVFTSLPSNNAQHVSKKLTFSELYLLAISTSPRCSKTLREKIVEAPAFGIDFAKICLLTNVGRINTTMAFFPEMRTVLRSYHPIPSLQKTKMSLQDAPRIKNCLKACFLPSEASDPPTTLEAIFARKSAGIVPATNVVNLLFVLSNHSISVSKHHFEAPFEYLDLFLPVNVSSSSRARAFLWLVHHYLEFSPPNPFGDECTTQQPERVPQLVSLSPEESALENVDTEEELVYGRRMGKYRSRFLQKQIADEEQERANLGSNRAIRVKFRLSTTSLPGQGDTGYTNRPYCGVGYSSQTTLDFSQGRGPGTGSPGKVIRNQQHSQPRKNVLFRPGIMVEYAWNSTLLYDALVVSDDEMIDEAAKQDYARRLRILNSHVRRRERRVPCEKNHWDA